MPKSRLIPAVLRFSLAACLFAAPLAVHPSDGSMSVTVIASPSRLQTDNLTTPLGIDDSAPRFSWQLRDSRSAACQTAYQVQTATRPELLGKASSDSWVSTRISSDQSLGIAYRGPALKPSTRYYWRVLVWDKDGKPYPPSEVTWWETGLLNRQAWTGVPRAEFSAVPTASWIGFETWEEAAVRRAAAGWVSPMRQELAPAKQPEQRVAYRLPIDLEKPVRAAWLFVTGQDVASAWVNGTQAAFGAPLPPWKQLPWKKYGQTDVAKLLHLGTNLLAIQVTHYILDPNGSPGDPPPMSATLAVQFSDGSVQTFVSGNSSDARAVWTASTHPAEGWTSALTEDSSWKPVFCYSQTSGGEPLSNPWPAQSVKALHRRFEIAKPVVSARLYATALGAYEVFMNGKRAGNDVLAPGWTDYRLRLKYQTYDVTGELIQGSNAIAALVAPGWYSTPLQWYQQPNVYGTTPPSLMAYLRIQYSDGSVSWVVTDQSWKASPSPILKAEIYDGETQDARLAQPGWNTAAFEDAAWKPAEVHLTGGASTLDDGQDFQPIRVERTLKPVAITEPKPGVFLYDMGQNFSGVEHLRLQGPAGTNVRVRTGEILNPDGTLYTENLRTALSTDHFILAGSTSGKKVEEFEPQFTYHGFRYLELSGFPGKPLPNAVEARVFHTDAPFSTQLETGSPVINQLWSNILWGQRSNFVGVPTDCPQRDERLGWTADAQVFWRAASFNMDLAAFSRKYTADLRGTQVASGQGTAVAGALYGIFAPGVATTSSANAAGWSDAGIPFGDWLSPEGPTKFPLVATAVWAYDVTLMSQMAHALGKTGDEARYAKLFGNIKAAFTSEFVRGDGYIAGADTGPSPFGAINNPSATAVGGDTQTGYVLALHMNLVPERIRSAVAQHPVDKIEANHGLLATGFLGTPYLLAVLTESGHRDLAYKLLLNTSYPSWGYLVGHGATTMWERWNGDQMRSDPSMNSYNHYAYGAVADWIYRYAAGIDTSDADPGFHTIRLHPAFNAQLGSIDFTYQSPYGEIHSAWRVTDRVAHWKLTIPANAKGWLQLTPSEAEQYKLNGTSLAQSKLVKASEADGKAGFSLPAGSYSFEVSGVQ